MHSTSHHPMRHRTIRTEAGCIRVPRQGRQVQQRQALREQGVLR